MSNEILKQKLKNAIDDKFVDSIEGAYASLNNDKDGSFMVGMELLVDNEFLLMIEVSFVKDFDSGLE